MPESGGGHLEQGNRLARDAYHFYANAWLYCGWQAPVRDRREREALKSSSLRGQMRRPRPSAMSPALWSETSSGGPGGSNPRRSANESASCRLFRTDRQESELLRAFGANFPLATYSQRRMFALSRRKQRPFLCR